MGSDTPLTFKGIPLVWDKLTERELASSQPAATAPRPSGARSRMGPPTGSDGGAWNREQISQALGRPTVGGSGLSDFAL